MPYAFLCHAPEDAAAARELGGWLARNSPFRMEYTVCGAGAADDLVEAAEQSMAADAVILLLSPASTRQRWTRRVWEPVLLAPEAIGRVGYVELRASSIPELLRRRHFFDGSPAGRRELKRWLLGLAPQFAELPPRAGTTAGKEEVEELRRRLADEPGEAAGVPAPVALHFAHVCRPDFEAVVWLDGTRRSRAGLTGDLAHAVGRALTADVAVDSEAVAGLCASRRMLVVFDNCAAPPFPRAGKCSVLLTSPHAEDPPLATSELARIFADWTRDEAACLAALRDVPAALAAAREWAEVAGLARAAAAVLRNRARAAELLELVEAALPLARAAGDDAASHFFEWERDWILDAGGKARTLAPEVGEQLALF